MENDARVALVGEENATSKKLMISAANGPMVVLTQDINGVHLVRINTFLLKLPIFYKTCYFRFKVIYVVNFNSQDFPVALALIPRFGFPRKGHKTTHFSINTLLPCLALL